jgi:hypothetical protein
VSTLAASAQPPCTSAVRRGNTASIVLRPSVQPRSTTQSRARGAVPDRPTPRRANAPPTLTRVGTDAASTPHTPARRWRPGRLLIGPVVATVRGTECSSQPRDDGSNVIRSSEVVTGGYAGHRAHLPRQVAAGWRRLHRRSASDSLRGRRRNWLMNASGADVISRGQNVKPNI